MQCLSRKEDEELSKFFVLFLSVGIVFYSILKLSLRVRHIWFSLFCYMNIATIKRSTQMPTEIEKTFDFNEVNT